MPQVQLDFGPDPVPPPPELAGRLEALRRPGWTPYPVGNRALARLAEMIEAPPSHRPPCLLIHGDTNNGKTTIAMKFAKDWNAGVVAATDRAIRPVLTVQNPPLADVNILLALILRSLGAPIPPNARIERKFGQLLALMKTAEVRMVVIDEIHNILVSKVSQRDTYLNTLKFLSNELQIPIVLIGTLEAVRAIQTDQQLGNRFEPFPIPRWANGADYAKFLGGLCAGMEIKDAFDWRAKALVTRIHSMSEGLTGETWRLMSRAAEHALRSGREVIDGKTLDAVEWMRPSERRK